MNVLEISPAMLAEFVRQRVAEALPNHVLRAIARNILHKDLGALTLKEAARWLKWTSPEALRRALARAGVEKIKTSANILTYATQDLIAFRERHRVKAHRGGRRGNKIVKMGREPGGLISTS